MKSAFLFLLVVVAASAHSQEWGAPHPLSTPVSMIELLASGKKYSGWRIRVKGVGYFEDGKQLFSSKESYAMHDFASSIQIILPVEQQDTFGFTGKQLQSLNGKYLEIEGIYEHFGREELEERVRRDPDVFTSFENSGAVYGISRIVVIEPRGGDSNNLVQQPREKPESAPAQTGK
jgi:hypothetical protein